MPQYFSTKISLSTADLATTTNNIIIAKVGDDARNAINTSEEAFARGLEESKLKEEPVLSKENGYDTTVHFIGPDKDMPLLMVIAGRGRDTRPRIPWWQTRLEELKARRSRQASPEYNSTGSTSSIHPSSEKTLEAKETTGHLEDESDELDLSSLKSPIRNIPSPSRQTFLDSVRDGPRALCLTVELSKECLRRVPYIMRQKEMDLKIDVFLNGELVSSTYVPFRATSQKDMASSLTQRFAGRRAGRLAECPWIINVSGQNKINTAKDSEAMHLDEDGGRARWNQISQKLRTAAAETLNSPNQKKPLLWKYLCSLSALECPGALESLENFDSARFGILDVVITAGKGSKFESSTPYLHFPTAMSLSEQKLGKHATYPKRANTRPVPPGYVWAKTAKRSVEQLAQQTSYFSTSNNVASIAHTSSFGPSSSGNQSSQGNQGCTLHNVSSTPCSQVHSTTESTESLHITGAEAAKLRHQKTRRHSAVSSDYILGASSYHTPIRRTSSFGTHERPTLAPTEARVRNTRRLDNGNTTGKSFLAENNGLSATKQAKPHRRPSGSFNMPPAIPLTAQNSQLNASPRSMQISPATAKQTRTLPVHVPTKWYKGSVNPPMPQLKKGEAIVYDDKMTEEEEMNAVARASEWKVKRGMSSGSPIAKHTRRSARAAITYDSAPTYNKPYVLVPPLANVLSANNSAPTTADKTDKPKIMLRLTKNKIVAFKVPGPKLDAVVSKLPQPDGRLLGLDSNTLGRTVSLPVPMANTPYLQGVPSTTIAPKTIPLPEYVRPPPPDPEVFTLPTAKSMITTPATTPGRTRSLRPGFSSLDTPKSASARTSEWQPDSIHDDCVISYAADKKRQIRSARGGAFEEFQIFFGARFIVG